MTDVPAFRSWRAFWRMPGSRGFGVLLAIFLTVMAGSVWLMYAGYVNPEDGRSLRPAEAMFAVYSMLTFESVYPLPREWYTAALYFVIPLMGLLVLGHGLVRLGRVLFDREAWEVAMASIYQDHVIVCGLGKVGFRVIRWLRRLGEPVVGIDPAKETRFISEVRRLKVPVVTEDARLSETLIHTGVEAASAIVPCADDDLTNLDIALEARRLNPKIKVVLRLFDDRLAQNIKHGFDIHTAFSTSALSAPAFAAAATRAPVDHAFSFSNVDDENLPLLTISKFTVVPESRLVGRSLEQLEEEFDVAVLLHRHEDKVDVHPSGDAVLAAGDGFVVSAEIEVMTRLAALTPPTKELRRRCQSATILTQDPMVRRSEARGEPASDLEPEQADVGADHGDGEVVVEPIAEELGERTDERDRERDRQRTPGR